VFYNIVFMFFLEILRTNLYEMQKINNGAHELRFFGTSKQPAYFNMRNDLCCSADSLGQIFNISEERFPPPKMVFPCCVKKTFHTLYMQIKCSSCSIIFSCCPSFSINFPSLSHVFLSVFCTHTHTPKKKKKQAKTPKISKVLNPRSFEPHEIAWFGPH